MRRWPFDASQKTDTNGGLPDWLQQNLLYRGFIRICSYHALTF